MAGGGGEGRKLVCKGECGCQCRTERGTGSGIAWAHEGGCGFAYREEARDLCALVVKYTGKFIRDQTPLGAVCTQSDGHCKERRFSDGAKARVGLMCFVPVEPVVCVCAAAEPSVGSGLS